MAEQMAPYPPGFPYNPWDAKLIGAPIDFLILDGLSDTEKELDIILLEMKTGKSHLNNNEKRVRDAVDDRRIRYEVYELPDENRPAVLRKRRLRSRLALVGDDDDGIVLYEDWTMP